jgi:hypothetical protein
MKYFRTFIYATISVCLINCSNEDDTLNISFTEKYEGSLWKLEDGWKDFNGNDFLRVVNDNNANLQPFAKWEHTLLDLDGEPCYFNIRYDLYGSIIENSNNTFQYECTNTTIYGYTNSYRITITVDGTILTEKNQYKFNKGEWRPRPSRKWYRSFEDVESLPLCYN